MVTLFKNHPRNPLGPELSCQIFKYLSSPKGFLVPKKNIRTLEVGNPCKLNNLIGSDFINILNS